MGKEVEWNSSEFQNAMTNLVYLLCKFRVDLGLIGKLRHEIESGQITKVSEAVKVLKTMVPWSELVLPTWGCEDVAKSWLDQTGMRKFLEED